MVARRWPLVCIGLLGLLILIALISPDEWQKALVGASTVAVAGVTIILVWITWLYVQETTRIADKTAESARATCQMVWLERTRDWQAAMQRPQLDMTTSGRPPDSFLAKVYTEDGKEHLNHSAPKGPLRDWAHCCWIRALVSNKGRVSAENVEVYITELHRYDNGSYVRVSSFAPRRLIWANTANTSNPRGESVLPNLHPDIDRYCDVGHIVHPEMERWRIFRDCSHEKTFEGKPVLELCVDWDGPPQDHALEPGKYQMVLALSCADNPPVRKEMHLHFTGEWYADDRMLEQGVTVEVLNDTPA